MADEILPGVMEGLGRRLTLAIDPGIPDMEARTIMMMKPTMAKRTDPECEDRGCSIFRYLWLWLWWWVVGGGALLRYDVLAT